MPEDVCASYLTSFSWLNQQQLTIKYIPEELGVCVYLYHGHVTTCSVKELALAYQWEDACLSGMSLSNQVRNAVVEMNSVNKQYGSRCRVAVKRDIVLTVIYCILAYVNWF